MDGNLVASFILPKSDGTADFLRPRQRGGQRNETSLGLDGHARLATRLATFLRRHRRPICIVCASGSAGSGAVCFYFGLSLFDLVLGGFQWVVHLPNFLTF